MKLVTAIIKPFKLDDVREALMHVAIYAGVPRANHAIKIAKQIFDESSGDRA